MPAAKCKGTKRGGCSKPGITKTICHNKKQATKKQATKKQATKKEATPRVVKVDCQLLDGVSLNIDMDMGDISVKALKSAVATVTGRHPVSQRLYHFFRNALCEDAGKDSDAGKDMELDRVGKELQDNDVIPAQWTAAGYYGASVMLMFCEPEWTWSESSPLIPEGRYALKDGNLVATRAAAADMASQREAMLRVPIEVRIEPEWDVDSLGLPEPHDNCLVSTQLMPDNSGKHLISIQVAASDPSKMADFDIFNLAGHFGVVRDGHFAHDKCPDEATNYSSWLIGFNSGGLYGNGKANDNRNDGYNGDSNGIYDDSGSQRKLAVLTAELDTCAGTLRFFKDGMPHGPGFTKGVKANRRRNTKHPAKKSEGLRWALCIGSNWGTDVQVKIVPHPQQLQTSQKWKKSRKQTTPRRY